MEILVGLQVVTINPRKLPETPLFAGQKLDDGDTRQVFL